MILVLYILNFIVRYGALADKQSQLCCVGTHRQPLVGKDSAADTKTLWEL